MDGVKDGAYTITFRVPVAHGQVVDSDVFARIHELLGRLTKFPPPELHEMTPALLSSFESAYLGDPASVVLSESVRRHFDEKRSGKKLVASTKAGEGDLRVERMIQSEELVKEV